EQPPQRRDGQGGCEHEQRPPTGAVGDGLDRIDAQAHGEAVEDQYPRWYQSEQPHSHMAEPAVALRDLAQGDALCLGLRVTGDLQPYAVTQKFLTRSMPSYRSATRSP